MSERTDAKDPTILELATGMSERLLKLERELESRLNRDEVKDEGSVSIERPQSVVGEIIGVLEWNIKKLDELHIRVKCEILTRIS